MRNFSLFFFNIFLTWAWGTQDKLGCRSCLCFFWSQAYFVYWFLSGCAKVFVLLIIIFVATGNWKGMQTVHWRKVLLVSSSRHPDRWIVPGGGMEPEEEPNVAAVREVCEEAGVKGTLGRLVGIFENRDRKHRTYVYVLIVTEVLEDWEDSVNIGRKREWFKIEDAIKVLQYHKPVQASYFETLRQGCLANNGTPVMTTTYSESSMSDIR
ncbi:diphosphoinositol polyphosphate phosphohydrolase 1 isoform 1-T1 [Spheniscus humboldti]